MWDTKVEKLLGKAFEPSKSTAENIAHLPPHMQRDKELRVFLWKYALYVAIRYPDRQSLEKELKKLWQVLEERYQM